MTIASTGRLPDRLDITARVGSPIDFDVPILQDDGTVADLTGWTAQAQVRENRNFGAALLHTFTVSVGVGVVSVSATATQTAAWSWRSAPWDLILLDSSSVPAPVVAGWVTVYPRITH